MEQTSHLHQLPEAATLAVVRHAGTTSWSLIAVTPTAERSTERSGRATEPVVVRRVAMMAGCFGAPVQSVGSG